MLEVDIYGDQQLRHRYPTTGEKILFGRVAGKIRFGDDFTDLSRWNFNLEIGGDLTGENYVPEGALKHSQSQVDARFDERRGYEHEFAAGLQSRLHILQDARSVALGHVSGEVVTFAGQLLIDRSCRFARVDDEQRRGAALRQSDQRLRRNF